MIKFVTVLSSAQIQLCNLHETLVHKGWFISRLDWKYFTLRFILRFVYISEIQLSKDVVLLRDSESIKWSYLISEDTRDISQSDCLFHLTFALRFKLADLRHSGHSDIIWSYELFVKFTFSIISGPADVRENLDCFLLVVCRDLNTCPPL